MKVQWKVDGLDPATSQSADDIMPTSGSLVLENGVSRGQIMLSVVADELPELSERFIVTLVSVDGGADIDTTGQTSSFTIRHVCTSASIMLILLILLRLFDTRLDVYQHRVCVCIIIKSQIKINCIICECCMLYFVPHS